MSNLLVYRFQNKVKRNSVNATLASFLKDKDGDLTEKERVWWALSAFWLPLAMKESGGYTEQEITQYALSAIARLQQQIAYLALALNLDPPTSFGSDFKTMPLPQRRESNYLQGQKVTETDPHFDTHPETEGIAAQEDKTDSQKTIASSNSNDLDSLFGYK